MTRVGYFTSFVLVAGLACTRSPSAAEPAGTAVSARTKPSTTATVAAAPSPATAATVSSPQPQATPTGGAVKNSATLLIELDPSKPAMLKNPSGQGYFILHDTYLQPSRLEVTRADGSLAPSVDSRATKKFDNTVRKSAFRRLDAGATLPLFQLEAVERDSAFELRWGPFRIGPLPPGAYTATVVWESRETHYLDEDTQKKRAHDAAFVGTVRSAATPFRLPLP